MSSPAAPPPAAGPPRRLPRSCACGQQLLGCGVRAAPCRSSCLCSRPPACHLCWHQLQPCPAIWAPCPGWCWPDQYVYLGPPRLSGLPAPAGRPVAGRSVRARFAYAHPPRCESPLLQPPPGTAGLCLCTLWWGPDRAAGTLVCTGLGCAWCAPSFRISGAGPER